MSERKCRECGCAEYRACVDLLGEPCHWIEWDLCSSCANALRVEAAAEAEGAADPGDLLL